MELTLYKHDNFCVKKIKRIMCNNYIIAFFVIQLLVQLYARVDILKLLVQLYVRVGIL